MKNKSPKRAAVHTAPGQKKHKINREVNLAHKKYRRILSKGN